MCVRERERERKRESCCACLLDGESRPGRKSEPKETPDSCFLYQSSSSSRWWSGTKHPRTRSWPQQRRGWLVGQSPMYLLPFFLGMGFLQGTMTLSLSEPEVQSSKPRSLGQREMQ